MSTTTRLITVEEYSGIPDPPGGHYELRHGELRLMPPPSNRHADIQDNICDGLKHRCGKRFRIRVEFACRPLPEYEVWEVDVGLTTLDRWKRAQASWLAGSPELAIEVLSPSNARREMEDRQATLFEGGCQTFWSVDPESRTVAVCDRNGVNRVYGEGESIPLDPYSADALPVSEIFDEL